MKFMKVNKLDQEDFIEVEEVFKIFFLYVEFFGKIFNAEIKVDFILY